MAVLATSDELVLLRFWHYSAVLAPSGLFGRGMAEFDRSGPWGALAKAGRVVESL